MTEIKEINGLDELNQIINETSKLVIFDCYATWCEPCKKLLPELKKLVEYYPNLKIYKVNIDYNDDIVEEYDITSLPTLVIYKNKKRLGEFIGSDIEKLKILINDIY